MFAVWAAAMKLGTKSRARSPELLNSRFNSLSGANSSFVCLGGLPVKPSAAEGHGSTPVGNSTTHVAALNLGDR